jgi:cephalosporin hydroxylase
MFLNTNLYPNLVIEEGERHGGIIAIYRNAKIVVDGSTIQSWRGSWIEK